MMLLETTTAINQKSSTGFILPRAVTEARGQGRVLECSSRADVEYNLFVSPKQPGETRQPLKDADEEWAASMLAERRALAPVKFQRFSLTEVLVIEVGAENGTEEHTTVLRTEEDIPVLYTPPTTSASAVTALAA